MKYIKILTSLFVAAAFMFSSVADAAEKKGKGKGGRKNPYAALNLSKEQQTKMRALAKTRAEASKKAREAKDKDAMKAAQKDYQTGLAKILTEEQMGKLKEIQAEMRKNRGAKGKSKGKGKGKGKGGDKKKKKDS